LLPLAVEKEKYQAELARTRIILTMGKSKQLKQTPRKNKYIISSKCRL